MVIPDFSAPENNANLNPHPASPLDRFLAGIFDLMLLVPIATFVPSIHIREARIDYLQGFESHIWYQVILLWILTYVVVQTAFLYFAKTTPGGMIMHLRVRSLNGEMSWNQCLLRSFFSLLSWLLLGLPFLEVITHPVARAWHDRISDSIVIDLKGRPFNRGVLSNVGFVRTFLVIGVFALLMLLSTFINSQDELLFTGESESIESTDSLVAQALLKKDFYEDTQNEIEERIWRNEKNWEKSLAYFFKLQVEKNDDVKKALSDQICKWSQTEKAAPLCELSKYSLQNKNPKLLFNLAKNDLPGLTTKVFLLKELTKNSNYPTALKIYEQIKGQSTLSASFKDSLKIWDVSLFWAMREAQNKSKRLPASDDQAAALKKFIQERGAP
jgi:uncharacterized RDD family membrane protein YckC